jgi:acyl-CoA synthetase (AMP-forming)/AMP-acid ligase II
LPSYGLTEAASQVATATFPVGDAALPEMQLLAHLEAKSNQQGFICLKGESLLTAYALLSPKGCELVDPKVDGWFITADLGQVEGGSIAIFGRSDDMIKIAGENVALKQLEAILEELRLKCGFKGDMALVAAADARLGHAIQLAVVGAEGEVMSEGALLDGLIADFQRAVLPFERIRKVHYVKELPRSALGKLKGCALRAALAEER